MKKKLPNFPLRMPEYLREFLVNEANKNNRFINAEILDRLEKTRIRGKSSQTALNGDLRKQINVLTEQISLLLKALATANLMTS